MQNNITIRDAAPNDAEKIVHFNKSMALETEDKKLCGMTLTSGVNSVLDDPSCGFYLVAQIDNKVVGSLMVTTEWSDWRDSAYWWIQSVYVEPACRRKGVFTALYTEAKTRAENTPNVCGLRLYVDMQNKNAQATYAKLGFKETNYKMYEEPFPKQSSPFMQGSASVSCQKI